MTAIVKTDSPKGTRKLKSTIGITAVAMAVSLAASTAIAGDPWQTQQAHPEQSSPSKIKTRFVSTAIDEHFGDRGVVLLTDGPYHVSVANALTQRGDKLLFGWSGKRNEHGTSGFVQLNEDGKFDLSFGDHGWITLPTFDGYRHYYVSFHAQTIQTDGKLLISGDEIIPDPIFSYRYQPFHARLLDNGEFDSSYGSYGWVKPETNTNRSHIQSGILLDADQWLTIVQYTVVDQQETLISNRIKLERRLSDGTLADELIIANLPARARSTGPIVKDTQGRLFFAFNSVNDRHGYTAELFRLNADGSHDSSFGNTHAEYPDLVVEELLASQDGSLILAGYTYPASKPALAKIFPDGSVDVTFGTQGLVTLPASGRFIDVVQLDNGKLLALGYQFTVDGSEERYTWLVRVDGTGKYDHNFGIDGRLLIAEEAETYSRMMVQNEQHVIVPIRCNGLDTCLVRVKDVMEHQENDSPDSSGGSIGYFASLLILAVWVRRQHFHPKSHNN